MLALDAELAADLAHDTVRDAEPQTGADTDRLGGEERIEDAPQVLFGNTDAGIFDLEARAALFVEQRAHGDRVIFDVTRLDGLRGVDQQVEHDLTELRLGAE